MHNKTFPAVDKTLKILTMKWSNGGGGGDDPPPPTSLRLSMIMSLLPEPASVHSSQIHQHYTRGESHAHMRRDNDGIYVKPSRTHSPIPSPQLHLFTSLLNAPVNMDLNSFPQPQWRCCWMRLLFRIPGLPPSFTLVLCSALHYHSPQLMNTHPRYYTPTFHTGQPTLIARNL